MDSPSAPAAPDPYVTANAQAGANKDAAITTAQLNRVNQYTPYGSLTWEQGAPTRSFNQKRYDDAVAAAQKAAGMQTVVTGEGENRSYTQIPGTGTSPNIDRNDAQFYDESPSTQWSSRINLDPRVQAILDAQLKTTQGLQGATDSALGRVNETFDKDAPTPDAAYRKQVEDALYGRYTSRLDPQYQQQEQSLRSDLMNRGIVEGSEAWKNQLDNFNRGKNDAYTTAMQTSIGGGQDAMKSQYGMEMTGRQSVLNELNALRSGQQVNMPEFSNTQSGASVGAAPIAQAMQNQYQGNLGMYNSQVASTNSNNQALMGLAGTAAMMFF